MPESRKPLTYAELAASTSTPATGSSMNPAVRRAPRAAPERGAELGGFGGLFDLKAAGFVDPILVAANDGVGTKVKIAIESGVYDTIGVDLVAMCVNDIVVQGAEPLFFLDYFASGKLDEEVAPAVVQSIAEACARCGMRIDRRRDGGDAGPLRPRRFRHRRLRRGRRRARDAAARGRGLKPGDLVFGCRRPASTPTGFRWCGALSRGPASAGTRPRPFDPGARLPLRC